MNIRYPLYEGVYRILTLQRGDTHNRTGTDHDHQGRCVALAKQGAYGSAGEEAPQ